MKRLNKTHIFHIFFGLLMFLPFISILSRVIYVQSNKNAKDSYSGNYEITYKYESNQVNSVNDLVIGNIYTITLNDSWAVFDEATNDVRIVFQPITEFTILPTLIDYMDETMMPTTYEGLYIEFLDIYMTIFSSEEDYNSYEELVTYVIHRDRQISDYSFVGKLIYYDNYDWDTMQYVFTYTDYNEIESVNLTGTLDNVFDYSISKFIEDNNFRINFFSWFEDLFLVQNGGVNALYLSFANWYMCYALLVSTGYLLFLILMWFINYVRKILEGGNSFGHGGF